MKASFSPLKNTSTCCYFRRVRCTLC